MDRGSSTMTVKYKTSEDVLEKAKGIYSNGYHSFSEIDINNRLNSTGNKGNLGQIVEEGWFEIDVNSRHEKDFPAANLELKVIPYIRKTNGSRTGKERLVVSMINYFNEAQINSFEESSFWLKADQILIMTYEHKYGFPKKDYYIDNAKIFVIPPNDLRIIKNDWKIIHDYIVDGRAHELSESLTNYLGACTKGADSSILVAQPNSDIPAKPRAYSLKGSYISYLIQQSLFSDENNESLLLFKENGYCLHSIESSAITIFNNYIGENISSLMSKFNLKKITKQINKTIVDKIILENYPSLIDEFSKSNTIIKTVGVDNLKDIKVKESMSFPNFKFVDIMENTWEDSTQREYFEDLRIFFIVFEKNSNPALTCLRKCFFYTLTKSDLWNIEKVYNKTRDVLVNGNVLIRVKGSSKIFNRFPKMKDNPVAHIRPHASKADYTKNGKFSDYIPSDNIWMTKQCFWLNSRFIKSIIFKHL